MFGSLYPGDFPDQIMPGRRIPVDETVRIALGDDLPKGWIVVTQMRWPRIFLCLVDAGGDCQNKLGYVGYHISDDYLNSKRVIAEACVSTNSPRYIAEWFRNIIKNKK